MHERLRSKSTQLKDLRHGISAECKCLLQAHGITEGVVKCEGLPFHYTTIKVEVCNMRSFIQRNPSNPWPLEMSPGTTRS